MKAIIVVSAVMIATIILFAFVSTRPRKGGGRKKLADSLDFFKSLGLAATEGESRLDACGTIAGYVIKAKAEYAAGDLWIVVAVYPRNKDLPLFAVKKRAGIFPMEVELGSGRPVLSNVYQTRDRDFDGSFFVYCDSASGRDFLRGIFDSGTRGAVHELLRSTYDFCVSSDSIRFTILAPGEGYRDTIRSLIDGATRLYGRAEALIRDPVPIIAEICVSDPNPDIRFVCTDVLAQFAEGSGVPGSIIRRMMTEDRDWDVKIHAAEYLGERGMRFLMEHFGEIPSIIAGYAISAIARLGRDEAFDFVRTVYENPETDEILIACVKSFSMMKKSEAEKILTGLLEEEDPEIVGVAVDSLGNSGSVHAVGPLLGLKKRAIDPGWRTRIDKAIRAIQSRLEGADSGRLEITDAAGAGGGLSIDDEKGNLEIT
jgi:hypothetical protein